MKTLKEIKAAMTADEMNQVKGGTSATESESINIDLIDEAGAGVKTISADCIAPNGLKTNCRSLGGVFTWVVGWNSYADFSLAFK